MELKARVLDLLERAYEEEQKFVAEMNDAERSVAGTPDHWSAKDVIAHSAAWIQRSVQRLAAAARDEPLGPSQDFEQVNIEIFEEYRDQPWDAILRLSEQAYSELVEQTHMLSEDDLVDEERSPKLGDRTPLREILGHGYTHPVVHLAQLYLERGQNDRATQLQAMMAGSLAALDASPAWIGGITYNLACHYALSGDKERALSNLGEALQLNPDLVEWSKEDPDLISLRDDPDYKSLYSS